MLLSLNKTSTTTQLASRLPVTHPQDAFPLAKGCTPSSLTTQVVFLSGYLKESCRHGRCHHHCASHPCCTACQRFHPPPPRPVPPPRHCKPAANRVLVTISALSMVKGLSLSNHFMLAEIKAQEWYSFFFSQGSCRVPQRGGSHLLHRGRRSLQINRVRWLTGTFKFRQFRSSICAWLAQVVLKATVWCRTSGCGQNTSENSSWKQRNSRSVIWGFQARLVFNSWKKTKEQWKQNKRRGEYLPKKCDKFSCVVWRELNTTNRKLGRAATCCTFSQRINMTLLLR